MPEITVEQALLGIILMYPEVINKVHAAVDDFQDSKNRKIYETLGSMHTEGEKIDLVTLGHKLPKMIPYLANLTDVVLVKHDYQEYDRIIREDAAKRKIVDYARVLLKMGENGSSPHDLLEKSQEIVRFLSEKTGGTKTLIARIDDWIANTHGTFFGTEMDKELGIGTNRDKENRKKILQRLEAKGRIVKASNRQGHYRIIDDAVEAINFREVKSTDPFPIRWPFDLQNYVKLLPKSIAILAGSWESGKTAFLLNVARMNMDQHQVRYMTSEMGDAEFKLRLDLFCEMAPDNWHIDAIERSDNYEDAVIPDAINIIDYLELSDNFFSVGEKIRRIFDKLRKGIAIIAIQKATGKELARGGDFTAEKARLYLTLDPGELVITKGKLWANPQVNPKNTCFKFKLWQGHKFVPQGDPYKKVRESK